MANQNSRQDSIHPKGGFQMPPEPANISSPNNSSSLQSKQKAVYPTIPMTPRMVNSIKQAPKGVIPSGLARYLAAKRAAKAKGGAK